MGIVPACLPFCLCAAAALETNVGLKLCCLHLSWIYCRYRPERLIIMLPHYLPLVGASLIALAAAQDTVSLAITAKPTAGASKIISPSFAGFGIESSNLYSFTGGSSENQLESMILWSVSRLETMVVSPFPFETRKLLLPISDRHLRNGVPTRAPVRPSHRVHQTPNRLRPLWEPARHSARHLHQLILVQHRVPAAAPGQ